MPLANAQGQTVRVEVTGEGTNDQSQTITELQNQKNSGTGAEKVKGRALSIVEAEFYEPVN